MKKVEKKTVQNEATKWAQILIAIGALIVSLGLMAQGAKQYLDNLSANEQNAASIVIVALLGYTIAVGLSKINR